MQVQVECHGPLAALCDGPEQSVSGLAPGATVADVLTALGARFPALAAPLRHSAVARGTELLGRYETVAEGDRLALIPPVSGG